jgi:hypothetical protein
MGAMFYLLAGIHFASRKKHLWEMQLKQPVILANLANHLPLQTYALAQNSTRNSEEKKYI